MNEKEVDMSKGEFVVLKQVRSTAGRDRRTKATLLALGLGSIGKKQRLMRNLSVLGMIDRVSHLIEVEA